MTATDNFFKKKRDWSKIKDSLLDWYLTPYLSKILATKRPLRIIDCFAGKGKFDDGKSGSPLIITDQIQKQIEIKPVNIQGVFIEKKYFNDLQENLSGCSYCQVFNGSYEDHFRTVLANAKRDDANLFIYIDPYGIKSLDMTYFELLKNFNSYELLMNFNSFGFLREGCRLLKYEIPDEDDNEDTYERDGKNNITHMNAIAGGDYWQKILEEYNANKIDMHNAEEKFTSLYSEKLNSIFKYTVNIPIKKKSAHLPKYRMLFGTNHPDGLLLMADNMHKQWNQILDNEFGVQTVLFKDFHYPDVAKMKNFNMEDDLLLIIDDNEILLKNLLTHMVLKYGISFPLKRYKDKLIELEKQKLVEIIRVPALTPSGKKAISMEHDGRNYKITIRRKKQWQRNLL